MPESSQRALGLAVRRLREQRSLSQEALADTSRLHRTYIGGVERGERNPSYASLKRIAEALNARVSELIALAEKIESSPEAGL